jgi:imidazolonepropionase-like amidohydrolase
MKSDGAEIIDASGKFIIPGLVDSHIHFFQSGSLYTRPDGLNLNHRRPYSDELKWIRNNIDDVFRRYLSCGITTIADMGGPMWNFDIKEYSYKAEYAPRTFLCGPLIASYQPKELTTDDPPIIKVTSIEDALKLVREQAEKKADYIKIWYVITKTNSSELLDFFPIAKAICDESHKLGLNVYVHATELETAKKAIEAGCDVLAHIITDKDVDEDFLKLCKMKNIIIIPTLWVFNSYNAVYSKQLKLLPSEHLKGNPKIIGSLFDMYELSDSELKDRQKKLIKSKDEIKPDSIILRNLKRIYDYGINVAAGTDAGNVGVIHGPGLFHEFNYMSNAGLTNREILTTATINPAKMLKRDKLQGTIEKGKLADLVILNSNPLENINNTSDIFLVMKNGKIFNPDSINKAPEDLAQIQLNAYNSRDLESFLSVYSKDVEIYKFPDSLRFKGHDEMKTAYTDLFNKAPELHCKLINRISKDRFVIDRELVTGIPGRENLNAVAIYEIIDGLIQKVWFLP